MRIRSVVSGAVLVAALAWSATSAKAATQLVTWTEAGIDVTWEQVANPTPISYVSTGPYPYTQVAVSDWTSTGTTSVGPFSSIYWYAPSAGGGFAVSSTAFSYSTYGASYVGSLASPIFLPGTYTGNDPYTGNTATWTISGVPETSTWVMMLAGFAGLAFAGYLQSRKREALAA
jgi:LPXTG-motif cell wall-anchored protein